LNQWYEFFIVVSSVNSCEFYIDCVPLSLTQTGTSVSAITYFQNGGSLGRQWTSGQGFEYFNGSIDNFRMWNRALTSTERTAICASDTNVFAGIACTPVNVLGQFFAPPIDTTFQQGSCTTDYLRVNYQLPDPDTITISQTACPGEVFSFYGQSLVAPDTAYHFNNCDSVFQLHLILANCSDTMVVRDSVCPGATIIFQGNHFGAPLDTFLISNAGDTIYHLILFLLPDPVSTSLNWIGCNGEIADTLGLTLVFPFDTSIYIGNCDTVLQLIGEIDPNCKSHCEAFFPNTFTPNADGLNDALGFTIPFEAELTANRVFNRWGQLIFETKDPTLFWDGTYQGQPAPEGVYYLRIQYRCNESNEEYVGFVTLLR
jgi:gliding motility-associated-like protein